MTVDLSITVSRHIEADAADIFNSWIDPDHARHWLFTRADGEVERCEIDGRPGGRFHIADRRGDTTAHHVGEFTELDPPHRLQFRFAAGDSPYPDLASGGRATVTIIPEDTGHRLTLVQELPPHWAEHEEVARTGWEKTLAALAAHLGVWVERPDTKPYDGGLA